MSKVSIEFGAKDTGLDATLTKLGNSLKGVEDNTKRAADSLDKVDLSFSSMAKAGAGFALGVGAIKIAFDTVVTAIGNFKDAFDFAGEMKDMSDRTGIAVEDLATLERAFKNAGLSSDDVQKAVNKMQRSIEDAGEGGEKTGKAFEKLGLNFDDIKTKTPTEQLETIGKKINELKTPAERTAVAVDLFGKSGADMLTVFKDGKNGIEEARKEIGSFGRILDENAPAMDLIGDKFDAIKNKGKEFATGLVSELLPALGDLTTELGNVDAAKLGEVIGEAISDIAIPAIEDLTEKIKSIDFEDLKARLEGALSVIGDGSIWDIFSLKASAAILDFGENLAAAIGNAVGIGNMEAISAGWKNDKLLGAGAAAWAGSPFATDEQKRAYDDYTKKNYGYNPTKGNGIKPDLTLSNEFRAEADRLWNASKEKAAEESRRKAEAKLGMKDLMTPDVSESTNKIPSWLKYDEDEAKQQKMLALKREGLELETKISEAIADGNLAEETRLEAQKKFNEVRDKAIDAGKTEKEAEDLAERARLAFIDTRADKEKAAQDAKLARLKDELSITEQITKQIEAAQKAQGIDKGGKLQKEINEQIDGGNFKRAKRLNERLADKIDEDLIRRKDGKVDRRNLNDIAKDMGIDVFRMDKDEMRAAIIKKRQDDLKPENKGLNKKEKAEKAEADKPAKADPVDSLTRLVEKIHGLVAKIEPKLPQHALN
jgi:hypothetical protein